VSTDLEGLNRLSDIMVKVVEKRLNGEDASGLMNEAYEEAGKAADILLTEHIVILDKAIAHFESIKPKTETEMTLAISRVVTTSIVKELVYPAIRESLVDSIILSNLWAVSNAIAIGRGAGQRFGKMKKELEKLKVKRKRGIVIPRTREESEIVKRWRKFKKLSKEQEKATPRLDKTPGVD
jgi:hypothetical protein